MGEQRNVPTPVGEQQWRNGINQQVGELSGQLKAIVRSLEQIHENIQSLRQEVHAMAGQIGVLRGKVAVWGMLGGALVSIAAQLLVHFLRR